MKPDTVLQLAVVGGEPFSFSRHEVPEKITFGGKQKLAKHELVGGKRVIDAMGRSDAPLLWSGLILGENALSRARYLDYLRISGKQCILVWSELSYRVVVESFEADFERFYKIPYRITCEVVEDLGQPVMAIASAGIDELIGEDMGAVTTLGAAIGDAELTGLVNTLDTAIKGVSKIANATTSAINSITGPLGDVQRRVSTLIVSVAGTASNAATLGGILPAGQVQRMASSLGSQAASMGQLGNLYNLDSTLGRMGINLRRL